MKKKYKELASANNRNILKRWINSVFVIFVIMPQSLKSFICSWWVIVVLTKTATHKALLWFNILIYNVQCLLNIKSEQIKQETVLISFYVNTSVIILMSSAWWWIILRVLWRSERFCICVCLLTLYNIPREQL